MTPKGKSELDNRPSNVFSAILHIVQTEGLGALYEGLHGEVLKGFFSHGTTMLVKDIVHKTIIRLYYLVLKLLKKYPNAKTLGGNRKVKRTSTFELCRGKYYSGWGICQGTDAERRKRGPSCSKKASF